MRVREWQTWMVPMAGGWSVASLAVAVVLPSHTHPLSWPGLVSRSMGIIALAAVAAVAALLLIRRVLHDHFEHLPAGMIACAWSTAIWLPLLLLLQSQHALWVMLAPVPIAAIVARHAKHQSVLHRPLESGGDLRSKLSTDLLQSVYAVQPMRLSWNAVASALLVQACVLAAAVRAVPVAESLFILTTACLVWGFTDDTPSAVAVARRDARRRGASVVPCVLLTCLAMTPFLLSGSSAGMLGSIVLAGARVGPIFPTKSLAGNAYSGVVLFAPAQKPTHFEIRQRSIQDGTPQPGRPLVIPFAGAYWFFEAPNSRPGADAPTQRGDPVKNHVRSHWPMRMEAHQHLGQRISTACCSSIDVHVTNADNRLGAIGVEMILRDVRPGGTVTHSLGMVPIRSSQLRKISLYRAPVQETLHFPTGGTEDFRFNEITLIFRLGHERSLAGAEVKVSDFALIP